MPEPSFTEFFRRAAGHSPHPWQEALASLPLADRLIRIPTGFGKTAGTLLTWAFHRCLRHDLRWPTRLAFCLPMRVLVEQTAASTAEFLAKAQLSEVGVHVLMGGRECEDWYRYPEAPAILVGTQDMLLSRALNRGYASRRARWPMEFGLLNQDCLWVMDEVQLMDVGLATSGQLQAFRRAAHKSAVRPSATWWMSATLQREWLEKSPETRTHLPDLSPISIPAQDRRGVLWEGVEKKLEVYTGKVDDKALPKLITERHAKANGAAGPTLVVVNKVDRAVAVFEGLQKLAKKELKGVDLRLVHSRFRPRERAGWREAFLNRAACAPGTNRIIVSTQVVEAGVDLSAGLLITDLAPWPSLVQRFGRAARWGGAAEVLVLDTMPKDDKQAAPYSADELDAARDALGQCSDVSPSGLESFEEAHPELRPRLYPYDPAFLLLEQELRDLFDTTPDLSGDDIDISRFIRTGEERDLHVAWFEVPPKGAPPQDLRPSRDALCPVPFLKAREWLSDRSKRAWTWDWVDGSWRRANPRDLYPGQTVVVDAGAGGYSVTNGWAPSAPGPIDVVAADPRREDLADSAHDDDALSAAPYKTICTHAAEVAQTAATICDSLQVGQGIQAPVTLAARHHDDGKAHPGFASDIVGEGRPARPDLAKAPDHAWKSGPKRHLMPDGSHRPGLRHELASTLALFAVLQRHSPRHPALLGAVAELLEATGVGLPPPSTGTSPTPAESELLALDGPTFDLVAFLICSHHGKIRVSWAATPADQAAGATQVHGVCTGDTLPSIQVPGSTGCSLLPESKLTLAPASIGLSPETGRAWTDRVLDLLDRHGPFALAWMEAVLRAADQRASALTTPDPLLGKEVKP